MEKANRKGYPLPLELFLLHFFQAPIDNFIEKCFALIKA
jgi:hypothetical protein